MIILTNTIGSEANTNSMTWLDEMNDTLEQEGVRGPERPERDEKARLVSDIRNTWLFNNALRHLGLMYLKHYINPFVDTDKWNLKLEPRLVTNMAEGSVRRNLLAFLQSAFFLLSLRLIKGDTIVDFSKNQTWNTYRKQPLCYCVFSIMVKDRL
jgi:hypothetical protein